MSSNGAIQVRRMVQHILDWPCDTFSIEYKEKIKTHTTIIFIPGNPGLIEWYIPMFEQIILRLGNGFSVHGISNAGHSIDPDLTNVQKWQDSSERDVSIPWTVDGQVRHKCAFVDLVMQEYSSTSCPRLVFVAHSIGAHLTQRMCVMRPDILARCALIIYLMPFVRMKAPFFEQVLLNRFASTPELTTTTFKGISRVLSILPVKAVDFLMRRTIADDNGRQIGNGVVRQPNFIKNFFMLGLEEIRDVPQEIDVSYQSLYFMRCILGFNKVIFSV